MNQAMRSATEGQKDVSYLSFLTGHDALSEFHVNHGREAIFAHFRIVSTCWIWRPLIEVRQVSQTSSIRTTRKQAQNAPGASQHKASRCWLAQLLPPNESL